MMEDESESQSGSKLGREGMPRSYKYIEYCIKSGVFINAMPFHYDKATLQLSLDRKSTKYRIWLIFMMVGIVLEWAQVVRELIRGLGDDSMSRGEWTLVLFLFLSWNLVISLHLNEYVHGEDMVMYHNQVIGVRRCFKEEELPKSSVHNLLRAHIMTSSCQCFFQCLMIAAEGWRAQYLYSNIPVEHRSVLTLMLWAPYAYYRVVSNFLSGYFPVFEAVFHVQTYTQISEYRAQKNLSMRESFKIYRMLQILSQQYNTAYSTIYLPQVTIFASTNIMLGFYGTIRFAGDMLPNLYLNFPLMFAMMIVFTFTFYPNNAVLKEDSQWEIRRMLINSAREQVLRERTSRAQGSSSGSLSPPSPSAGDDPSRREELLTTARRGSVISCLDLNSPPEDRRRLEVDSLKEAVRMARSCPYLAVTMGTFYPIKQSTVLNLFDFICCNTISALLTW